MLQCVEHDFLTQVIDSSTGGVALLDLRVTSASEQTGDIKIGAARAAAIMHGGVCSPEGYGSAEV